MPTPTQASSFSRRLAQLASADLNKPSLPETPDDYVKEEPPRSEEDVALEDISIDDTLMDEDQEEEIKLDQAKEDGFQAASLADSLIILSPLDDDEDDPQEFHRLTQHINTDVEDHEGVFDLDTIEDDLDDQPLDINRDDLGGLHEDEDEDEDEDDEDLLGESLNGEHENDLKLFDFLAAFFSLNKSPTDDQFHALASALGIEHEELEAKLYHIIGIMLEDDEIDDQTRHILSSFIK